MSKTRGRRVGGNVYCAEHRDCEKKLCTVADLKEKNVSIFTFGKRPTLLKQANKTVLLTTPHGNCILNCHRVLGYPGTGSQLQADALWSLVWVNGRNYFFLLLIIYWFCFSCIVCCYHEKPQTAMISQQSTAVVKSSPFHENAFHFTQYSYLFILLFACLLLRLLIIMRIWIIYEDLYSAFSKDLLWALYIYSTRDVIGDIFELRWFRITLWLVGLQKNTST